MVRKRVLSFMSQLSGGTYRDSRTPSPPDEGGTPSSYFPSLNSARKIDQIPPSSELFSQAPRPASPGTGSDSTSSPRGRPRSTSRPLSIVHTYHPHIMETNDAVPELQPIFTLLNSHANKLYQEGYFFKLDDQNAQGRQNADRNWTECFAQLAGTVLSLWDASELDAVGETGEVLPKFINLTDASIKVIDSLPVHDPAEEPLQHILSVSTAGRNRYLLHFNSHDSLMQWTAGIRLAIFEHSTLQEAYTGALIAGKGRTLNNINLVMSRTNFKTEEWVRVRFGAGVPWRRCWCVISPPDEKELQKQQKEWKKRSPYDRSHMPHLKGDIKFYDTRKEGKKQKKAKPIVTITNAFSAYAIYPQAKALIDASTLIKLEGTITIHSDPPSTCEGFMFMMPEVPPAVTGFELLLRFLFPIWDAFGLYGRPGRLVASTLDSRSLMFAMPNGRRFGYLEVLDVVGLLALEGSSTWTEHEWRKRLKDLIAKGMSAIDEGSSSGVDSARASKRSSKRLSFAGIGGGPFPNGSTPAIAGERSASTRPKVNFADDDDLSRVPRSLIPAMHPAHRNDSAPPASDRQRIPSSMAQAATISAAHNRNFSDTGLNNPRGADIRGANGFAANSMIPTRGFVNDLASTPERVSFEDEAGSRDATPPRDIREIEHRMETPEPVQPPPAFHHSPSSRPSATPYHSAELRRANSRLSSSTLAQIISGGKAPLPANGWMPTIAQETRPVSRRGDDLGNTDAPTAPNLPIPPSASVPSLIHATAPNTSLLSHSKSPLNQTHSILAPSPEILEAARPQSADSRYTQSTAHSTKSGPLPPPPTHTGHSPSHVHDRETEHRMFLAQGHNPLDTPTTSPPSASFPSPSAPEVSSQDQPQAKPPLRTQSPPPKHERQAKASPLSPLKTSSPIHRKPVPSKTDTVQRSDEAREPQSAISSAASLQDYYIDEAALAKVQFAEGDDTEEDESKRRDIMRQGTKRSEVSSRYDDGSSTTSPDYASTHESVRTQEPAERPERPRAGVLKTVGATALPVPAPDEALDIPKLNFGPTINYAAQVVPKNKTSTPLAAGSGQKVISPAQPIGWVPPTVNRGAPREQRPTELSHLRQESDDTLKRRSVAWQPGSVQAGTNGGASASEGRPGAMTPEQFVMQRVNQAATPIYAHQRAPSGNSLAAIRNATPSPTMRRRSSFDMLSSAPAPQFQQAQRPSSQGASTALHSRTGSTDPSSHLSAREQEHLARMTGTPLINMVTNSRGQQNEGGPGLVGAIAAREREKQQMKEGYSSQAVQYAINQRQQQQQQQQLYYLQHQQQQQMFGPSSTPSMYGGYQLPPGQGLPQAWPQQGLMGSIESSYGQQIGWGQQQHTMPGGWPTVQEQEQGFPQGPYGQPGGGLPRLRTPGSSGRNMMHPGQAF